MLVQNKKVYVAKDELNKVIRSDVQVVPSRFRLIYQLTGDDNLSRFNIVFSDEAQIMEKEKMELGLSLIKNNNNFRNIYKRQYKCFKL